jgi:hypothetical protein
MNVGSSARDLTVTSLRRNSGNGLKARMCFQAQRICSSEVKAPLSCDNREDLPLSSAGQHQPGRKRDKQRAPRGRFRNQALETFTSRL